MAGFVCQSAPAAAILAAGSDCGMPYAPLWGLVAPVSKLLSRVHSQSRHVVSRAGPAVGAAAAMQLARASFDPPHPAMAAGALAVAAGGGV